MKPEIDMHLARLLLFDIDGTLIRSAGAGRDAMNLALQHHYSVADGFRDVQMMGRTDPLIIEEVFRKHRLPHLPENVKRFQNTYFEILESELEKPRENKRICTGIVPLLDALEGQPGISLGLLTGNWRTSAFLKLRHFGLEDRFELGAFSDDAPKREDLVPVAMDRFYSQYGIRIDAENVYVIGDTPLDVACARPHGCKSVAVATGFHTVEELKAASPDFIFGDFSHTEAVLELFRKPNPTEAG